VVVEDGVMRWLEVVVRTRRARGRLVGRTDEMRAKRASVVVVDGRGMHIVGGESQAGKVVRRMLVIAMLRVLQRERRNVRTGREDAPWRGRLAVPFFGRRRCRFSYFTQKYRFFGIADAFYDKIQNAAYSYSGPWHTRDSTGAVDG
jgi:hypothetical protein